MKQQSPEQLREIAAIVSEPAPILSRRRRLERWADVLEAHAGPLQALYQIEYLTHEQRRAYRDGDSTPMALAHRDPVLRGDGLAGDTLGDAMDYFGITDDDAHDLFCDCHYMGRMTGRTVATHLRRYAHGGFTYWAGRFLTGHWG